MQNLTVGHATSLRPAMPLRTGAGAVTIRHEVPFQASARFAEGPFFPAQCAPTSRQLASDAQETSLANTLAPCAGLGTSSVAQMPPLSRSASGAASCAPRV